MSLPDNVVRKLIVCIILSAAFYGAWAVFGGVDEVLAAAGSIGWIGWGIILGLSLFNYLLRFLRWDYYLRHLDCRVPPGVNMSAYLAGFGFTTTPGKVGEAIRSIYLKPYGVSYKQSLAAFFVERFSDMLAMIVVASLAAYAFADMRWLVGVTLIITLAFVPLVHSRRLPAWLEQRAAKADSEKIADGLRHLVATLASSSQLLRSVPLYGGLLIGLIAWFA
ncbi:MAG: flippase-like domain-containing protein, partial [Gammaproteobacteria bacterium]|nr:flippase-like domain-containing protein [Gammaproteobacteria bacterium]